MAPEKQSITSLQKDSAVTFPPPASVASKAFIESFQKYQEMYDRSVKDSHKFWLEQATNELVWFKKPTKTLEWTWDTSKRKIQHSWFSDGELNLSVNCLDRHLAKNGNKIAILWQGEKDEEVRKITYSQLHEMVCRFANVLLAKGVKKGIGFVFICR